MHLPGISPGPAALPSGFFPFQVFSLSGFPFRPGLPKLHPTALLSFRLPLHLFRFFLKYSPHSLASAPSCLTPLVPLRFRSEFLSCVPPVSCASQRPPQSAGFRFSLPPCALSLSVRFSPVRFAFPAASLTLTSADDLLSLPFPSGTHRHFPAVFSFVLTALPASLFRASFVPSRPCFLGLRALVS